MCVTVNVYACFLHRKFLIRQLCREYGIQAYMTLAKIAKQERMLDWIIIQEPTKKVHYVQVQSRGYIIIMLATWQLYNQCSVEFIWSLLYLCSGFYLFRN